jgi:hypothetical protein
MPTTLTGLLLFIVLLLPGFAYVVGKERNGTRQQLTPFHETAAVVAASISFELIVLVLFAVIRTLWPSATPDVGALIRGGGGYLRGGRGHAGHYGQVAIWVTGMLALSTVLAYLATLPRARKFAAKVLGPYPHHSTVSAWWLVFETWQQEREIHIGCILDDESYVEGWLGSFNSVTDDKPERDLVLTEPILYRPPGADNAEPYECGAVCVSASRIVAMFVNYSDQEPVTSLEAAVEAGQVSTAVAPSSAAGQAGAGPVLRYASGLYEFTSQRAQ